MKQYTTFLIMVLIAGAAIFWQDIVAIFAGMSPLEALQTIVTYFLHVAVGTVAAVVIFGLPKVIQPWLRMVRRNQRRKWQGGPNAQWKQKAPRMPRLTAEQKFWLMMARANGQTRRSAPTSKRTSARTTQGQTNKLKW